MKRARKACSQATCPHLQPCPVHPRKAWAQTSPRNESRLSGWEQQRRGRRVLERDGYVCHVCRRPGADQVDHVDPLGPDDESNLRAIHAEPCHREKTSAEASAARARTP